MSYNVSNRRFPVIGTTILLLLWLLCSSACQDPFNDDKQCFDPDDPCPNDMIVDELGCYRDQCPGDVFWGERVPCFWQGTEEDHYYWTLVGEGGRYLAYVQDMTEESGIEGPIWLYDLESGETRMLTEPDRLCTKLRADGNRIAWIEIGEETEYGPNARDVYIKDVVTGEEWQVPNPNRRWIDAHSIGGDHVSVVEVSYISCQGYTAWDQIWVYDLVSGERTMVADSMMEEEERYSAMNAEVADGKVAYWHRGGLCGGDSFSQLRIYDIETRENRLFKEWSYSISMDHDSYEFLFDGKWLVYNDSSRFNAHTIDGTRVIEGPVCPFGGCLLHLSSGMVAYALEGEDDLKQTQTYVFDLESEQIMRITDLRPYFDKGSPQYFLDGRLVWSEFRGKTISDDCGDTHPGYPGLMLFWKDIEF